MEAAWGDAVLLEDESGHVVASASSILPRDVGASSLQMGTPETGLEATKLVAATKARMMIPMLNDNLRNEMYKLAIEEHVDAFKQIHDGRGPRVLDIGAGTGLLSVLAAQAGAREVVGCEMNAEMAKIAKTVVEANGLQDIVKIEDKRSSDYVLGDNEDPFDMIVTETLDSHLLREGIVPSLQDALDRLSRPGAAVVPASARVFAQLCSATLAKAGVGEVQLLEADYILKIADGRSSRLPSPQDREGFTNVRFSGCDSVHSLELLGDPVEIFEVNFADARSVEDFVRSDPVTMTSPKTANGICIWWELNVLATVSHEDVAEKRRKLDGIPAQALTNLPSVPEDSVKWQDHWFPVVHPLVEPKTSVEVGFGRTHTEIFVEQLDWAPATMEKVNNSDNAVSPNSAVIAKELNTCMEPFRLLQVADRERQMAVAEGIKALLDAQVGQVTVWDIGAGSMMALQAARIDQVSKVLSLEADYMDRVFWTRLCKSVDKIGIVETLEEVQKPEAEQTLAAFSDLYYAHLGPRRSMIGALQFALQAQAIRAQHAKSIFFPSIIAIEARLVCLKNIGQALTPPTEICGVQHPVEWSHGRVGRVMELDVDAYEHNEVCGTQELIQFEVGTSFTAQNHGSEEEQDIKRTGTVEFSFSSQSQELTTNTGQLAIVFTARSAVPQSAGAISPVILLSNAASFQAALSDLADISVERFTNPQESQESKEDQVVRVSFTFLI